MRIILVMSTMRYVDEFINQVAREYPKSIKRMRKYSREIELANGNVIKGYSENARLDGLSADVAIGERAEELTWRSKETNRVWSIEDLEKHISNVNKGEQDGKQRGI